ncbi:MAG: cation transporter [Rhodobacteraceae bacterium PARR1]|nr:MAG: cation transporter [Rhodobacteraceae bacterium PARR1]
MATPPHPIHDGTTPGYARALWLGMGMNLGYGVIEVAAGLLSGSQALKADSLDFLGDGLVSLLALLAIRWTLRSRAKVALAQGIFLGLLGLGVLGQTIAEFSQPRLPEGGMILIFGLMALAINILSALLLIPYRKGDASAEAVWLFARNDAIGNVGVVVAAGLVIWTGAAWPDRVVALLVAGLFLQSAFAILRDARADLARAP